MPSADQPTVLHVARRLLSPSETFVQQRLVGDRYAPVAAAWERVDGGLQVPCPTRLLRSRDIPALRAAPLRNVFGRLASRADILRLLLHLRPAVVHAHFGVNAVRIDRECRWLGIPLVVSFYGFDAAVAPHDPIWRAAYERMFRSVAAVTAEGPTLARALADIGAPPRRVKLLPLGLPAWALDEPERRVGWDEGPLRLLQVARFVEKKGVDLTLKALAEARRAGCDARLTLIGDGELRPQIETLVRDLALGEAVELLGWRPHDELPRRLAECHALIQPSRTASNGDTEGGHPTVLVEAQAQGVPVLATTHADIPQAVHHEVTGLLVPEDDTAALAAAIRKLADDRSLLASFAHAARPRALRRHDPGRLVALRERVYREAIRVHRPTAPATLRSRTALEGVFQTQ